MDEEAALPLPVCSVSQTNSRLTSSEEWLWWQDDATVVRDTGCQRPCAYTEYHLMLE